MEPEYLAIYCTVFAAINCFGNKLEQCGAPIEIGFFRQLLTKVLNIESGECPVQSGCSFLPLNGA